MMGQISQLIETLKTGTGLWNPLIWIVAIVIAFLIVYIIRSFGNKDHKKGTEQTKSFLSGNPEYEKEASNVYGGFLESLKWVYAALDKMHTGNISDYVLWFVVIMGVFFIIMGVL